MFLLGSPFRRVYRSRRDPYLGCLLGRAEHKYRQCRMKSKIVEGRTQPMRRIGLRRLCGSEGEDFGQR